jgi:hypothetical protein
MRKLCAILAGLLVCALTGRADLIVYSQKIVVTKTGGGTTSRSTTTGWAILDGQTGDLAFIDLFNFRGRFHVNVPTDHAIDNLSAGFFRDYMVIALPGTGVGAVTFKGRNTTIDIGSTNTNYSVPFILNVTGSDLFNDGDSFLNEYRGSLVYNRGETRFANSNSFTLEEEVEDLRQYLLDFGYEEE